MKRLVFLALILVSLLSVAVFADAQGMPYDIERIIDQRFSGANVTGYVNPAYGNMAFVALQLDGTNYLVSFQQRNGGWAYSWQRKETLPQNENDLILIDRSNSSYGNVRLGWAFSIRNYYADCFETLWEYGGDQWYLRAVFHLDSNGGIAESFIVTSGGVQYNGWDGNTFVSGSVQDNIRYFVYSVFPKSLSALRNKLSTPPYIPDGMLQAQEIQFTGGNKYEVYSGPGEEYLRGGNGKAMVSTNDWIQVFGSENDWILIQYNISNGHMRFGWIPKYSLPSYAYVNELSFVPVACYTLSWVSVTDDPLNSQAELYSLPEGATVYWLATMGDWAYIEYYGEEYFRGFVPLYSIASR